MLSELKQIPEFNNYYLDKNGNIYSNKYNKLKKLSPYKTKDGYRKINLYINGKYNKFRLSRLMLMTFVGMPENDDWEACHKNDIRNDDRLENLEWNSHQYNMDQIKRTKKLKDLPPDDNDIF